MIQEGERSFIGRIKRLSAVPDAETRESGLITILFLNENEKKDTASIRLTKEDYDVAIEAHKEGKTVKVAGTLLTGQKIIECKSFEVLD